MTTVLLQTVLLHVTKATLVQWRYGVDHIFIEFEGPSPFPKLDSTKHSACAVFKTEAGHGKEWFESVFGTTISLEVVEMNVMEDECSTTVLFGSLLRESRTPRI